MAVETYGVVDLGSNSFHLVIWQVSGKTITELVSDRQLVQIGYGLNEDGSLTAEKRSAVIAVLQAFRQTLAEHGVERMVAVGTEIFRRIHEVGFLADAAENLGAPITIIDGDREASLIYRGVIAAQTKMAPAYYVVDIGGASSEFIVGDAEGIMAEQSLPLGCVMASRTYFPDQRVTQAALEAGQQELRRYLAAHLTVLPTLEQTLPIGASGTIRAVTALMGHFGEVEAGVLLINNIPTLLERLVALAYYPAIAEHFQIPQETATILPAGALLVYEIFRHLGIERLQITESSMREGLLAELMAED